MTIKNGRFVEETWPVILDAMMDNAIDEIWGEKPKEDEYAALKAFYRPIAKQLAHIQEDIGLVLDSSQIEYASDRALDLLCALINVKRYNATKAKGKLRFYRNNAATEDHTISKGTIVQTNEVDPIKFKTTEAVTLKKGEKEVSGVLAEAIEPGEFGNIASDTLTVMTGSPSGPRYVTNPQPTYGGEDRENDEELRTRAMNQSNGLNAVTAKGMKNALRGVEGVTAISLFSNDKSNTDSDGLKPHTSEYVVNGGDPKEIIQLIGERKGAGGGTQGGIHGNKVTGTADLNNGDSINVEYSEPPEVRIDVNLTLDVISNEYPGDDQVKDEIAGYIGGHYVSGNEIPGELNVGRDVISTQVVQEALSVDGVYDVTLVEFDKGQTASFSQGNITMARNEIAVTFAEQGDISITTNQVERS